MFAYDGGRGRMPTEGSKGRTAMPKVVDHEQRRQQIVDTFLTLVERGRGL